jgi:thiamine biosynthesis lipoprotein ApbE
MGSRYTVRVVMRPGDDAANDRVRAAIEAELDRVDRLFSRWRPESEVSRLGAHASTEPFPISAETMAALALEGAAVATSGDYRKAWTDGQGRRRSHIIDPRSGEPIAHGLASASVVERDGARADALATALLVLGPDDGRALAARERLAAHLVRREPDGTYTEWSTPAFETLVPRGR